MDRLPNMTLKPSRLKWIMVLLGCSAFVASAIFLIPREDDPTMWWLTVSFFGLGALASIATTRLAAVIWRRAFGEDPPE